MTRPLSSTAYTTSPITPHLTPSITPRRCHNLLSSPSNLLGLVLALVVLAMVLGVQEASGSPSSRGDSNRDALSNVYSFISREGRQASSTCFSDPSKQYTCEMCAKQTRSLYVFKLCCISEANALNWCRRFLAFGIN